MPVQYLFSVDCIGFNFNCNYLAISNKHKCLLLYSHNLISSVSSNELSYQTPLDNTISKRTANNFNLTICVSHCINLTNSY